MHRLATYGPCCLVRRRAERNTLWSVKTLQQRSQYVGDEQRFATSSSTDDDDVQQHFGWVQPMTGAFAEAVSAEAGCEALPEAAASSRQRLSHAA